MKLRRLIETIEDLEIKGSKDVEITGLCANSALVSPGNLFIAKKGLKHDGNAFTHDAVSAGAHAILTDLYDPFIPVTQLITPHVEKVEALLSSHYYNHPSLKLEMIGITGTNGKTTASFLIHHMLEKMGLKGGLIGSVEYLIGKHHFPSTMTTPDVITTHKLLREMVMEGCGAAVMEVSSHGLSQNRVGEIDFDVGLFTNFTQDHLDYHKDMESYRRAKERLFLSLKNDRWAVFNRDDPTVFQTHAQRFTYGIENKADLMAKKLNLTDKKTQFIACYGNQEVEVTSKLIGKFNVYNVLGAMSVCLCMGKPLEECAESIKSFKGVQGRLQRTGNIFVDFAHTPDALENVLKTLNEVKRGKLIVVFGAGGDRDRKKRPLMGKVAEIYADLAIITSDNPRSEDPETIAREILEGFSEKHPIIELDRKKAIEQATSLANPDDLILIAGKGHEKYQIFSHQIIPFDDLEVAKKIREGVCG